MTIENYAYAIVLLFALVVIIISIWNLFAFDKNNEDETIYFILNIIAIILSVGIIVWAMVLLFGNQPQVKVTQVTPPEVRQYPTTEDVGYRNYIASLQRQGTLAYLPPPSDLPPNLPYQYTYTTIPKQEIAPIQRYLPTVNGVTPNISQGKGIEF
jgi:hypothetical protein